MSGQTRSLGDLLEWTVPSDVADELRAGRMPDCRGIPGPVRYRGKDATDRLAELRAVARARQDQLRCRLDELVDEYPELKSQWLPAAA